MKFDHVALNVKEIRRSVLWYREHLHATVLHEDDTWAFLEVGGSKVALTVAHQHPPHVAFDIGPDVPSGFLDKARKHRDGSLSRYVADPDGNAIEWIYYPSPGRGQ
jgi:catechol-2,3-dioxygenase